MGTMGQPTTDNDTCSRTLPLKDVGLGGSPDLLFDSYSIQSTWLTILFCCYLVANVLLAVIKLYSLFIDALEKIRLKFQISIQVTGTIIYQSSEDDLYHNLLRWVDKNCGPLRSVKATVKTIYPKNSTEDDSDDESQRPSPNYAWVYKINSTIGYGDSTFCYKGAWFQVSREVIKPRTTLHSNTQERLTFSTFYWNRTILEEIMDQAKPKDRKVRPKDDSIIEIYKANIQCLCWNPLGGPKKKRPINTLVLDTGVIQRIVKDIGDFQKMEDWYLNRGIPYRRSYLLYGPPGCGKTSVVKAIAGEMNYSICVLSLSNQLTDDGLVELFNSAPTNSVILLEDIDAVFKSRENEGATAKETNLAFEGCSQSALTFMGLLNALDGVASSEDGQLVFMTTNYPERLDPALIRPGRVDLKIPIDYPQEPQIEEMFKKFYPEDAKDEGLVKSFSSAIGKISNIKITMAMLQGLLVVYRDSPNDAIANCEEHFSEQFTKAILARDK